MLASNSTTFVSPGETTSLTPKSGIERPCVVSPAGTLKVIFTCAPCFTRTSEGVKENFCIVIATSKTPGVGDGEGCCETEGRGVAVAEGSTEGLALGTIVGVGEGTSDAVAEGVCEADGTGVVVACAVDEGIIVGVEVACGVEVGSIEATGVGLAAGGDWLTQPANSSAETSSKVIIFCNPTALSKVILNKIVLMPSAKKLLL